MGLGNTSSPCSPLNTSAQPSPRPLLPLEFNDMMNCQFGGVPSALQPNVGGTSEGQEPTLLSDKPAATIGRGGDDMLCSDDESDCPLLGHLSYPAPFLACPGSPLVLQSPSSVANDNPAATLKVHGGDGSGGGGRDATRRMFVSSTPTHFSNTPTQGGGTPLSHQLLPGFSSPHGARGHDSPGVLRFSEGSMSCDPLAGFYFPSASPSSGRVNNDIFVPPYEAPPARLGSPLIDAPGWQLPGSPPPGGPAIAPFMRHMALT